MSLPELLNTPHGVAWLQAQGVHVDPESFLASLSQPRDTTVRTPEGRLPVCTAQQIYSDYRWSVLAKVNALLHLPAATIHRSLLWSDIDRCGSDSLSAAIGWPRESGPMGINLVSTRRRDAETRFAAVAPEQIKGALNRLHAWAIEAARVDGIPRREVLARVEVLSNLVRDASQDGLRAVNQVLTRQLFEYCFGKGLPDDEFLSDLFLAGRMDPVLERTLNRLPAVIATFNAAVEALAREGVDVGVPPRDPDWLPLFLTCERDQRRLKLVRTTRGADTYAVGRCKCGASYELALGGAQLGITHLAERERLSPDLTLLIYVNDLYSGIVAGKSSALYGLVLNRVMTEALDMKPVPMLLPPAILRPEGPFREFDGLVHAYVMGRA